MPLPTKTDVQKLDRRYLGAPFCSVEAKPLNTQRLDWSYLGAPFVAVPNTATVVFRPIVMWM